MARKLTEPSFLPRDGTSQQARTLAALDPESVRPDERTIQDLVAFARELGTGLVYYGLDNTPAGDWRDFIGALDPELVAGFLDHPERFDPALAPALFRPHFVLFLAFLRLFQRAQGELNAVTMRHLDFYYRRVLQMATKGPVPDRVSVIFDLARGEREILVPEGSLVDAGPDSLGREQVYRTEQPIIVNRIQIARKSAVFVERRRTGFPEARAQLLDQPMAAFLEMLQIALGRPLPAFPLPPSPGPTKPMTVQLLAELTARARVDTGFYLSVSEISDLVSAHAVGNQAKIDAILAISGQRQLALHPPPVLPRASDVVAYWTDLDRYFLMPPESFHEIMQRLVKPDWTRVDAILEAAHQRRVREERIRRFRAIHQAHPADGLAPLLREALGDDAATETKLRAVLGRTDIDKLDSALQDIAKPDPVLQDHGWEKLYGLLEVAQRSRTGEHPAQKVEWIDVVPAEDAPAAGVRPVLDGQVSSGRWATFGLPRPVNVSIPPAPVLGWAISSPLLWLREGARVITLTFGIPRVPELDDATFQNKLRAFLDATPRPLAFQLSTAKGWVECTNVTVTVGSFASLSGVASTPSSAAPGSDLVGLQFTLALDATVDPIAPLPPLPTEAGAPDPVLRLMLRPLRSRDDEPYTTRYPELASLSLVAVHLEVGASEIRPQRLQNDERTLDPRKPFEPFGGAPAVGSRFLIGHTEISGKDLDSLTLDFPWMGAPGDFAAYYATYALTQATDAPKLVNASKLTVRVSLIDRGQDTKLVEKAALFASPSTSGSASISSASPSSIPPPNPGRPIHIAPLPASTARADSGIMSAALADDLTTWRRYLQCELDGSDFGHAVFPAVAASKAIELATAIANHATDITAADYKVNPPYTPKLKSLTLAYTASLQIRLDAGPPDARDARILYVHPFGQCDVYRELGTAPLPTGVPFLSRYDNDGELYLGLAEVAPPQSVSLLFQLADGSADPDLPSQPVVWSYLDGDRWIPFAHRMLRDTTGGLIGSGIIELALDPVAPSTRLGGGLYWIRAAVEEGTASVCDTIDIHPQAVSAVFVDHDNAPDHFRDPLPPATIEKLSTRISGIAGVRQPYTSRGGRPAEAPGRWATRVSERLRHKQRAISMWDYERLVLEKFPQIYKARCLPASADVPGKVEIIVIPDVRNLLPSDPFEPKAPSSLLREIATHLRDRTPAFADLAVRNARYIPVLVQLAVRFTTDGNDAFYVRKLNDDLNRFLSPWAFEDGSDIVLGGLIYANSIVDFVDRRDYVDYVAAVKLYRRDDQGHYQLAGTPRGDDEGDFVAAGLPDAVLVAARTHDITVLKSAAFEATAVSGINFMKVELDFIVG